MQVLDFFCTLFCRIKSKRHLRLSLALICGVFLLGPSHTRSETKPAPRSVSKGRWRELSRNANKALYQKKLARAVELYKEAILSLLSVDADSESVYNLKMNLAEVKRQQSNYKEAEQLLDEVGNAIRKRQPRDPFLAARYWRRRSRLQESLRLKSDAADSELNAFSAASPHFSATSRHTIDSYGHLVFRLCELGTFGLISDTNKKIENEYHNDPKTREQIKSSIQSVLAKFCMWSVGERDLKLAGTRLVALCTVYEDLPKLVNACRVWFRKSQTGKAYIAQQKDLTTSLQEAIQRQTSGTNTIESKVSGQTLVIELCLADPASPHVEDTIHIAEKLLEEAHKLHVGTDKTESLRTAIVRLRKGLASQKVREAEDEPR